MKELIIIGFGQYGQNVRDIVISNGNYETISFADDKSNSATYTIAEAEKIEGADFVVAIGNPRIREKICTQMIAAGKNLISLIHNKAYVASSAKIGKGCIVEPGAIINANVVIEDGALVCAGAIINHNVIIGHYSQIDVGAVIPSNKKVEEYTKVEAGETYV